MLDIGLQVAFLVCGVVVASTAGNPEDLQPFTCGCQSQQEVQAEFEAAVAAGKIEPLSRRSPVGFPAPRGLVAPRTGVPVVTRADVFLYEDSGDVLSFEHVPADVHVILHDASEAVIAAHGDVFDFIGFFSNFDFHGPTATAMNYRLYNDVTGIGMLVSDSRPYYNMTAYSVQCWQLYYNQSEWSSGPVESDIFARITQRVIAHETEHRFAMRLDPLLDGRAFEGDNGDCGYGAHWTTEVDAQGSAMQLLDWVGSNPAVIDYSSYAVCTDIGFKSPEIGAFYSYLDLYLMGYITPEELDTLPSELRYMDESCESPYYGPISTFSSADIIAANGPRIPDSENAQKHFRTAWVMIHRPRVPVLTEEIDNIVNILNQWTETYAWSTLGRGSMNNTLQPDDSDLAPTVSGWSLSALALFVVAAGAWVCLRRRPINA